MINKDAISSNGNLRQLPENWVRKPTEDGNTYFYYNVITQEIRWSHPEGDTTTSNSDIDENDDKSSIASSQDSQISSTTDDTIQQQRKSIDN